MMKLALAGVIAVASALGAGYFAIGASAAPDKAADPAHFGGLDYVRLEPFAVPIIEDGALEGYVLTELVFTIDARTKASLSVPPEFFIREDAFRSIYGEVAVDFDNLDRVDLEALGQSIAANVNKRLETEAIASVLVQRFDYVARGAIRDNAVREQP